MLRLKKGKPVTIDVTNASKILTSSTGTASPPIH
ncbi:hypothetical protein RBB78_23885 [Tunturiibacter empetritectus]